MTDATGRRRPTLVMAGLALTAFAAYLPALSAGFTADDFFILHRVQAADGLSRPLEYLKSGFFGYFRPMAFLSHAIDWHWWGSNAFGFHLTNVLLHVANALLVFLIGRRLISGWGPAIASLLFALHPASHEAVYWVAARFDLLATGCSLAAIWLLAGDGRGRRTAGLLAFALGLLSKESAISVLMIAPAWDVFIARRNAATSLRRILPLVAVVAAYVVARTLAVDVDAAGGDRRLPKMLVTAAAVAISLLAARRRDQRGPDRQSPDAPLVPAPVAAAAAGLLIGLVAFPATFPLVSDKLGFAAYAAFYSLSPVVLPPPAAEWFVPSAPTDAAAGMLVVIAGLVLVWRYGRAIARSDEAVFLLIFIAAALVPVSSMTGGLRYLYFASAGVALLAAWGLRRVPRRGFVPVGACVAVVLVVSCLQIVDAGRVWKQASDTIRDGVTLMAKSLGTCGTTDVLLLTAPVGIGGVYSNVYRESFEVLTGCAPRSLTAVLRMVGTAVPVSIDDEGDGRLELRMRDYQGNIVASEDLRNFGIPIPRGHSATVQTAAGRLETYPEGDDQVFRLALTAQAQRAARFLYSGGAIKAAPRRP